MTFQPVYVTVKVCLAFEKKKVLFIKWPKYSAYLQKLILSRYLNSIDIYIY